MKGDIFGKIIVGVMKNFGQQLLDLLPFAQAVYDLIKHEINNLVKKLKDSENKCLQGSRSACATQRQYNRQGLTPLGPRRSVGGRTGSRRGRRNVNFENRQERLKYFRERRQQRARNRGSGQFRRRPPL